MTSSGTIFFYRPSPRGTVRNKMLSYFLKNTIKQTSGEDSQKPMSTEEIDGTLALELQKKLDLKAKQSLEADSDASQAQGRSASTSAGTWYRLIHTYTSNVWLIEW